MARPKKDDLSSEEWAMIEGYGDRVAAGIISEHRGANLGSISQAQAGRRSVSHEWVAQQRKNRQKTKPSENSVGALSAGPSENSGLTGYTGTRISRDCPPGGSV